MRSEVEYRNIRFYELVLHTYTIITAIKIVFGPRSIAVVPATELLARLFVLEADLVMAEN